MNALAISLQGVGYPALVLGLQGLVEFSEESGGGGVRREFPRRRPMDRPVGRIDERTETWPQEALSESVGTQQTPTAPRTHAVEAASPQRDTAAQMLRAELAQIETRARERRAQFAALQEQMSAGAKAAEMAAMQAARKRDNNRRAQILIALLMLN
jgi:hypothetical protein